MIFFVNPAMEHINFGTALLSGFMGYAVVFFGLILLMVVIILVGKGMKESAKTASSAASATTDQISANQKSASSTTSLAPGSAGNIKLHDVPERQAALIMAITAHQLGKPLNVLRFQSIREVK